jgi:hypothetical protein
MFPLPCDLLTFFINPTRIMDKGSFGVLALDGHFRLITEYELVYADFDKQHYRID